MSEASDAEIIAALVKRAAIEEREGRDIRQRVYSLPNVAQLRKELRMKMMELRILSSRILSSKELEGDRERYLSCQGEISKLRKELDDLTLKDRIEASQHIRLSNMLVKAGKGIALNSKSVTEITDEEMMKYLLQ